MFKMFNINKNKKDIKGAIMGAVVGDALGVPFEFMDKEDIDISLINKLDKRGRWGQQKGTWSDDSSMILCTMESLCTKYDIHDIGDTYVKWVREGYWTPFGITYDIGSTVGYSIRQISRGDYSGTDDENKCGNGSLMRIIPLSIYLYNHPEIDKFQAIKEFSSLTHSHIRCIIGCAIYTEIVFNLLNGDTKKTLMKK